MGMLLVYTSQSIKVPTLPDKWYCSLNSWDPTCALCGVLNDFVNESLKNKAVSKILQSESERGMQCFPMKSKLRYAELYSQGLDNCGRFTRSIP